MKRAVLAQISALRSLPASALKDRWRQLFNSEPPAYNRRFLESRLAYRIQELAYGGLADQTLERLRALAKQQEAERKAFKPTAGRGFRPIVGTKLIREWQGIQHTVTVRANDYEYLGRPYKSLSSVAKAISGTQWNGWAFFGLKE